MTSTSLSFRMKCLSSAPSSAVGSVNVNAALTNLKHCSVVVASQCIYQTPLEKLFLQGKTHDFFVVEVVKIIGADGKVVAGGTKIRAEKTMTDDNGNPGINVRFSAIIREAPLTEKIRINDLHVTIPMAQLLEILSAHCPHYDILEENCWKYAHDTYIALLKVFADLSPEDRDCINDHIEHMPPLQMPVQRILGRIGS